MPRKTIYRPPNRDAWTFGQLLSWHLFVYGTRPDGNPESPVGKIWTPKRAADALGITTRTLWHWLGDKHPPFDTATAERVLFGDNPAYDIWRLEIQESLRTTRAGIEANKANEKSGQAFWREEAGETTAATSDVETERAPDSAVKANHGAVVAMPPPTEPPLSPLLKFRSVPVWMVLLLVGLGALGLQRLRPEPSSTPDKQAVAVAPPPETPKAVPAARVDQASSTPTSPAPTLRPVPQTSPPVQEKPKEAQKQPDHPPKLTEEQQREIEEARLEKEAIAARKAAHDAAERARVEEAQRRDQDEQAKARTQRDRAFNARQAAGIGFTLQENSSVNGQSIGYVLAETVNDCALACLKDNCDAFSYHREEPITALRKGRTCYRYKGPLSFETNANYTSGQRMPDAAPTPAEAPRPASFLVAQAGATEQAPQTDGVVQCANGPVKVTGFQITCDSIMTGGKTLGSVQLRYSVGSINECAAKCRPHRDCVGFTYNAADPPGRQACEIFGGAPLTRESSGWITGQR